MRRKAAKRPTLLGCIVGTRMCLDLLATWHIITYEGSVTYLFVPLVCTSWRSIKCREISRWRVMLTPYVPNIIV